MIFFSNYFFRKNLSGIQLSVKQVGPRLRHFVGPGLGPTCLQRLPADDTIGKER